MYCRYVISLQLFILNSSICCLLLIPWHVCTETEHPPIFHCRFLPQISVHVTNNKSSDLVSHWDVYQTVEGASAKPEEEIVRPEAKRDARKRHSQWHCTNTTLQAMASFTFLVKVKCLIEFEQDKADTDVQILCFYFYHVTETICDWSEIK